MSPEVRAARRLTLAGLFAFLLLPGPATAVIAGEKEDCLDLVKLVSDEMAEDAGLLSRLRGELAEAETLCNEGKTEEAEAILRGLQAKWMPMGMGN